MSNPFRVCLAMRISRRFDHGNQQECYFLHAALSVEEKGSAREGTHTLAPMPLFARVP
jgi:hypothetical protein